MNLCFVCKICILCGPKFAFLSYIGTNEYFCTLYLIFGPKLAFCVHVNSPATFCHVWVSVVLTCQSLFPVLTTIASVSLDQQNITRCTQLVKIDVCVQGKRTKSAGKKQRRGAKKDEKKSTMLTSGCKDFCLDFCCCFINLVR